MHAVLNFTFLLSIKLCRSEDAPKSSGGECDSTRPREGVKVLNCRDVAALSVTSQLHVVVFGLRGYLDLFLD